MMDRTAIIALGATGLFAMAVALAMRGDAPAPPEIHYSPAENLERIDVREIEQAESSIDMAAYVLTDVAVISALTDAAQRGVRVRVYRDGSEREPWGAVAGALGLLKAAAGVEEKVKPAGILMHLKSYCVDGRVWRGGAANFSRSGETEQDNDLVLLRGPHACDGFARDFEAMWKRER